MKQTYFQDYNPFVRCFKYTGKGKEGDAFYREVLVGVESGEKTIGNLQKPKQHTFLDLHHRIEHLDIETPQKRNLLVYIEPIYMDSLIIDSEFAVNDFVKADSIFKNSAPDLEEGGTATVRYLDLP